MSNSVVSPPMGFWPFTAMAMVWLAAAYLTGQYVAVFPLCLVAMGVSTFNVTKTEREIFE